MRKEGDWMPETIPLWNCGAPPTLHQGEVHVHCKITQQSGTLKTELTKEILKKAAVYKKTSKDKNFRPYEVPKIDNRN